MTHKFGTSLTDPSCFLKVERFFLTFYLSISLWAFSVSAQQLWNNFPPEDALEFKLESYMRFGKVGKLTETALTESTCYHFQVKFHKIMLMQWHCFKAYQCPLPAVFFARGENGTKCRQEGKDILQRTGPFHK